MEINYLSKDVELGVEHGDIHGGMSSVIEGESEKEREVRLFGLVCFTMCHFHDCLS